MGAGTGTGVYRLSGGALNAHVEDVGSYSTGTGTLTQSGGTNATGYLNIGPTGCYQLNGGTLQISSRLTNSGIFDGGNSPAVLSGSNCIFDFSTGTLQNTGATVLNMGVNSLLIVPAGFNPSTSFSPASSLALTYTIGSPLGVPAGQGFCGGWASINDHVNCQGTINAVGGDIDLDNGLVLSGTGCVNLGSGTLAVNDLVSGSISGSGPLSATAEYVGYHSSGRAPVSAERRLQHHRRARHRSQRLVRSRRRHLQRYRHRQHSTRAPSTAPIVRPP